MAKFNLYIEGISNSKTIGGYGCVITKDNKKIAEEAGCTDKEATVNRMKLWSILIGLRMLPDKSEVTIYSDDDYAIKAAFAVNKRMCNLDILNAIDYEKGRMKKVDYKWLADCDDNEKRKKNYCASIAESAINRKNYTNIMSYMPNKCAEPDDVENMKEEMERKNKINEIIDNITKELFELKKII